MKSWRHIYEIWKENNWLTSWQVCKPGLEGYKTGRLLPAHVDNFTDVVYHDLILNQLFHHLFKWGLVVSNFCTLMMHDVHRRAFKYIFFSVKPLDLWTHCLWLRWTPIASCQIQEGLNFTWLKALPWLFGFTPCVFIALHVNTV
jgi:hypothetical protein